MDSEGRSISSAMPIPNWMKARRNNRFDLEQSAFSPTEMDDAYLYLSNTSKIAATNVAQDQKPSLIPDSLKDISQHPAPCQQFLQNPQVPGAQQVTIAPSGSKLKSCGVDDGFKGEAAKCGSSILRVAHQMVASRGFFIGSSIPEDERPEGFNPARRGSKSLPASPIMSPNTSPKPRRRHKYFTSPFVDPETGREGGVLSNLLGRRDLSQSLDVIAEKEGEHMKSGISLASFVASATKEASSKQTYNPQPSELREMNFWSPTSM